MARNWRKIEIAPGDILDAAKTLNRNKLVFGVNVLPDWVSAEEYLSWAVTALNTGGQFGYDAAVCYAKRAVCRLVDSLVFYNHLGKYARNSYPAKIKLLGRIGVDIKNIVYDIVVESRNNVEHGYSGTTERQARHAVDLASMVIPPLSKEAELWATVTLGLNYASFISAPNPNAPDGYSNWNWDWDGDVPFLLVDYVESESRVLLVCRKNEEVRFSRLAKFEVEQAVQLAGQLREQDGTRISCNGLHLVRELKHRLELFF